MISQIKTKASLGCVDLSCSNQIKPGGRGGTTEDQLLNRNTCKNDIITLNALKIF